MSKCRVRLEMKKDRNMGIWLRILKRECNKYGIPREFKDHEFFQRKCDIRRRKRMQAKLAARLGDQEKKPQDNNEW